MKKTKLLCTHVRNNNQASIVSTNMANIKALPILIPTWFPHSISQGKSDRCKHGPNPQKPSTDLTPILKALTGLSRGKSTRTCICSWTISFMCLKQHKQCIESTKKHKITSQGFDKYIWKERERGYTNSHGPHLGRHSLRSYIMLAHRAGCTPFCQPRVDAVQVKSCTSGSPPA